MLRRRFRFVAPVFSISRWRTRTLRFHGVPTLHTAESLLHSATTLQLKRLLLWSTVSAVCSDMKDITDPPPPEPNKQNHIWGGGGGQVQRGHWLVQSYAILVHRAMASLLMLATAVLLTLVGPGAAFVVAPVSFVEIRLLLCYHRAIWRTHPLPAPSVRLYIGYSRRYT